MAVSSCCTSESGLGVCFGNVAKQPTEEGYCKLSQPKGEQDQKMDAVFLTADDA